MLSVIDGVDVVFEFLIQIPLYVLGMAAGFGEGIYALIEGLITLIYGIVKWFVLLIMGFIDRGEQFNKYNADIIWHQCYPSGDSPSLGRLGRAVREGLSGRNQYSHRRIDRTNFGHPLPASAWLHPRSVMPKLTVSVGELGVMRGVWLWQRP